MTPSPASESDTDTGAPVALPTLDRPEIRRSARSRWLRRGLIVLLLVAAALALRLTVFQPKMVPVTIFRVARGRVEDTVTNSKAGTIKSRYRASLSTEVGGRVVELPVRSGDRVRRGQLLVRLFDGDYRAQLLLEERSLEAARATENEACQAAELAERELQRRRSLVEAGIVAKDLLDQAENRRDVGAAACEAARARSRQAQAAVALAQVHQGKTILRAPFDAVVAEVSTEVGEWITPSPPGVPIPPVIDLIDPDAIYVSAPLDEVDVAKVKTGLPARITLDAYPERSYAGRVVKVAPYVQDVQAQNRTFDVEVEFADQAFARRLLPGTSADVEVILATRDDVLRIPSYALIEGGRVLVARAGTLVSVPVKTGLKNWEFAELLAGLQAGEQVVVSLDRVEVHAGARVEVVEETHK
jgi:HlyD family secretion protein